MIINEAPLKGVLVMTPRILSDERGYFYESYLAKNHVHNHIPPFVQENHSRSKKNVLRGLHFQQQPNPQGKLVSVIRGEVWDVVVDIRRSSTTFGQWFGIYLNDTNHIQVYIPPGFAHGFCVISDEADFYYKCTDYYCQQSEQGILWNDPTLAIPWPVTDPILSQKDMTHPLFHSVSQHVLFT